MVGISGIFGTGKYSFGWRIAALAVLLPAVLAGCAAGERREAETPAGQAAEAEAPGKKSLAGEIVKDSFGNTAFYTTVSGDTVQTVSAVTDVPGADLNRFNGLQAGAPLQPGTKLRLTPGQGPVTGARGAATYGNNGIAMTYVIEPGDTLDGITHRFGLTDGQLAEANKVPYVHEVGNVYFVHAGRLIQLQKKPVDSRAGAGATITNSYGHAISYTTVDGDSFDSLGYKFRSTTEQILLYNPGLVADEPIRPGTKVILIPNALKIFGAQGTSTAGPDGIPLTYTTAPGDTERQVSFRFGVTDLRAANRPSVGGDGAWYALADLPAGEFLPGQTISLALDQPINRPVR